VRALFPELEWPDQLEIDAGRYIVRPRYEINALERHDDARACQRRAHRSQARSQHRAARQPVRQRVPPPGPLLPRADWRTSILPTPMALTQETLPLTALVFDADGREVLRHRLGALPRDHRTALDSIGCSRMAACRSSTATSS